MKVMAVSVMGYGAARAEPVRYLFIDGGYLRKRYTETMTDFFGAADIRDIDFAQIKTNVMKAFYYDCIDDLKKQGETDLDFENRIADQEDFFNSIRSIPGYHVIQGSMTGTRPRSARQKQVDVHLAVDMLNHAVRHNMSHALLLTGDLDFKPAIEALIDLGIWTQLQYVRGHTAQELVWSADEGAEINFHVMYSWSKAKFQSDHRIPTVTRDSPSGAPAGFVQLRVGSYRGEPVWLYGIPNTTSRTMIVQSVADEIKMLRLDFSEGRAASASEAMIEKYFKTMYGGEVQW
jgi:uncharacterized LabA/DUF88 family protein